MTSINPVEDRDYLSNTRMVQHLNIHGIQRVDKLNTNDYLERYKVTFQEASQSIPKDSVRLRNGRLEEPCTGKFCVNLTLASIFVEEGTSVE